MRQVLVLAYDGRPFAGWQRQLQCLTVQEALEEALEQTAGEPVRVHASGRTDAGVHAQGQVVHFDVPKSRESMSPENWLAALNTRLPATVRLLACEPVEPDFHAQFQAQKKHYRYRVWTQGPLDPVQVGLAWAPRGQLDLQQLTELGHGLCGRHDFAAFAASRADGSDPERGEGTTRLLERIELEDCGPFVELHFIGEGFLYRMVRLLVGGMVEVARGRFAQKELLDLLNQPLDKPLRKSPLCAPADGLSLQRVFYLGKLDNKKNLHSFHPWD